MSAISRLSVCVLLAWQLTASGTEIVRFPTPEFAGDRRYDYALQLLQLGLSKSGGDYRIQMAEFPMNQERQVVEIEAGRTLDVGPIPSSAEREERLLPIRIPVNKGI